MYAEDKQNILRLLMLALINEANYRRVRENDLVLQKREMNVDSIIYLLTSEFASIDMIKSNIRNIEATYRDSLQAKKIFFYYVFIASEEEIKTYKEDLYGEFEKCLQNGVLCDMVFVDIASLDYQTIMGSKIVDRKFRKILEKDLSHLEENLEKQIDENKEIQEELSNIRKVSKLNIGTILILINAIIFFIGQYIFIRKGYDPFIILGIQDNDLILKGQVWRLVTSMFLHADISHLFGNMISLFYLSSILLPHMRDRDFVFLYFVSGLGASISSFFFTKANSLGASGAIMGLGGYMIYAMFLSKKGLLFRKRGNFLIFAYMIIFNLVHGLFTPNIDNYGHFGGFFVGLIIAYWFMKGKEKLYDKNTRKHRRY